MADTARAGDDHHRLRNLLELWFDVDPADTEAMKEKRRRWFTSTPAEDAELAERFGTLARDAAAGVLDGSARDARDRLALIILLDQLPRNLHRGTPEAYAQDAKALELCLDGMRLGRVDELAPLERVFHCMPLQHAESLEIQELSVATFAALAKTKAPGPLAAALKSFADYAVVHRDIIERFGRFPHRNATLGREPTAAELEFLEDGGPSFGQ